jgi:hypothetical protein
MNTGSQLFVGRGTGLNIAALHISNFYSLAVNK